MIDLRHRVATPTWKHALKGTHTKLIATPRELAALATRELFARSGLDPDLDILKKHQGRMVR